LGRPAGGAMPEGMPEGRGAGHGRARAGHGAP